MGDKKITLFGREFRDYGWCCHCEDFSTGIGFVVPFAAMKGGGLLYTTSRLYLFGYDYDARVTNGRNNGYCAHCAYVVGLCACLQCKDLGWWTIRRN